MHFLDILFCETGFLCCFGAYTHPHSVDHAGLILIDIRLTLPSDCWDPRLRRTIKSLLNYIFIDYANNKDGKFFTMVHNYVWDSHSSPGTHYVVGMLGLVLTCSASRECTSGKRKFHRGFNTDVTRNNEFWESVILLGWTTVRNYYKDM